MLGSSAEFIMFMERTSNYRYKPGTANRPNSGTWRILIPAAGFTAF
jgi:hypothetical protein